MAHKSFIAVNLFMKSATYLNVYLRQLYIHTNSTFTHVVLFAILRIETFFLV